MIHFFYTTKPGDWLSKIALKYYGDAMMWPEIYELNKSVIGDNPNVLNPGLVIFMPNQLNDKMVTTAGLSVSEKAPKAPSKPIDKNKILTVAGAGLLAYALFL